MPCSRFLCDDGPVIGFRMARFSPLGVATAGADGHLAKPITMVSLFGAIDAAVTAVEQINDQQAA